MKRFELVDKNTKIPPSHRCFGCEYILFDAFECKNDCGIFFCEIHLPQNKRCEECGGEFALKSILSQKIKEKYGEINCLICSEKMLLKNFEIHLKEGCKKDCTQNCGKRLVSEEEIKNHIETDCINTVISCIGCHNFKDSRGLVLTHQELCEDAQRFFKIIDPIHNKISFLERTSFT